MITPEQQAKIDQVKAQHGIKPVEAPATNDWFKKASEQSDKIRMDAEVTEKPGILGTVRNVANDAYKTLVAKPAIRLAQLEATGIGKIVGGDFGRRLQENAKKDINVPSPLEYVGGKKVRVEGQKQFGEGGVRQIASDAAKSTSYLVGAKGASAAASKAVGGKILGAGAAGAVSGGVAGGFSGLGHGLEDPNKNVTEVALDTGVGAGVGALAGGVLGAGSAAVSKGVRAVLPSNNAKIATAIDAVNPDLGGKKLTQAYKGVATGQREAIKGGVLNRQELTAPKDIQELGTRLSSVIKTKNPLKNLDALGKDLNITEERLTTALNQNGSELTYLADKPGLMEKIESSKTNIPREFAAIRESKSIFDDVTDFAKKMIHESDDSIAGIREARTAFDNQAKTEYPNAFKEGGFIDVKTPAGRAIKQIRDLMNEHLYDTAPNGSELRELIRREADIFKAMDFIAPKAAETHGLTTVEKILRAYTKHPIVASLAGLAAIGAASYAVGKNAVQASGE